MSDFSSIDKNFTVPTKIKREGLKFYNIKEEPFKIYGVYQDNGLYRRLPREVAETVSEGVLRLHAHTAGGRVRFTTNSSYVAVYVKLGAASRMSHFPLTGSIGCDLYVGTTYRGTFIPPFTVEDTYEAVVDLYTSEEREITINLPLYSEVKEFYVGIREDATLGEPSPYLDVKPIVYYGSSITQGGCASRPGMCYQNIIARRLNCDYINLGFSGNAKAEDTIIEYINGLDMSVFVYDYDHNAPNAEYLKNTHEKMFRAIRERHPDLPIILMSRPRYTLISEDEKRREIVRTTYNNALAAGDKNIYFLDNIALSELCGCDGMVDATHPTDLGFLSMAKPVGDVLETIFKKQGLM